MNALVHQRCLHHGNREAVARCPECKRFYCRECVSEHDNRILCAGCLRRLLEPAAPRRGHLDGICRLGMSAIGFALIWFFFFLIGRGLIAIPSSFHEGNIWKTFTVEQE